MQNSPFEVFRRNQKTWLAILGVFVMISWLILPNLSKSQSSGRTAKRQKAKLSPLGAAAA